jgi:hypothetical protein
MAAGRFSPGNILQSWGLSVSVPSFFASYFNGKLDPI